MLILSNLQERRNKHKNEQVNENSPSPKPLPKNTEGPIGCPALDHAKPLRKLQDSHPPHRAYTSLKQKKGKPSKNIKKQHTLNSNPNASSSLFELQPEADDADNIDEFANLFQSQHQEMHSHNTSFSSINTEPTPSSKDNPSANTPLNTNQLPQTFKQNLTLLLDLQNKDIHKPNSAPNNSNKKPQSNNNNNNNNNNHVNVNVNVNLNAHSNPGSNAKRNSKTRERMKKNKERKTKDSNLDSETADLITKFITAASKNQTDSSYSHSEESVLTEKEKTQDSIVLESKRA